MQKKMLMAETEKQMLERAIRILEHWTVQRTPAVVQLVFLELRNLDQSNNHVLWSKLRETLATNTELLDVDLQDYIYEPELAKNGWWWYDRNLWRK